MSPEFVHAYETDNIKFVQVYYDSPLSINDERFVQYYNFLQLIQVTYVTMVDISDVVLVTPLMYLYEKYDLCVGSDSKKYIAHSKYMKDKLQGFARLNLNVKYNTKPTDRLLNAGVVGGKYGNIMNVLKHGVEIWESIASSEDFSMVVVNIVLHQLDYNVCVGYPYTSEFKKFESRNDVMFRHK